MDTGIPLKTIAILGVGIILLGLALWWSVSGGPELEDDEPELVVLDPDDPGAMGMRGAGGAAPEERRRGGEESGEAEVSGGEQEVEIETLEDGETLAVGPREWAAEPGDVDVEALEEELAESEMEQAELLVLRRDRRAAIEVGREVIEECRGQGRIDDVAPEDREHLSDGVESVALALEMETEAGRGRIGEVEVLHRQGARGVGFEACVVEGLSGQAFEAEGDGGALRVEFVDQVE